MSDTPLRFADSLRPVLDTVARIKAVWKNTVVLERVFAFAAAWGALLIAALALPMLFDLPPLVRLALLVLLTGGFAAGLIALVLVPLFREWTDEEVARHIEQAYPHLNNGLINALLLARDTAPVSPDLVEGALAETALALGGVDFSQAVDRRRLKRHAVAACLVAAVFVGFAGVSGNRLGGALERILNPSAPLAFRGSIDIVSVEPGNAQTPFDRPVPVRVTVTPHDTAARARLHVVYDDGESAELPMPAAAEGVYALEFANTRGQSFDYHITVGRTWLGLRDSRSAVYRIEAVRPVVCRSVDAVIFPPPYTGLEPRRMEGIGTELPVPAGSRVALTFNLTGLAGGGTLTVSDGSEIGMTPTDSPDVLRAEVFVPTDRTIRLAFTSQGGLRTADAMPPRRLVATPDAPPTATIGRPAEASVRVPVGGSLDVVAVATDDYGVAELALIERSAQGDTALAAERPSTHVTRKTLIHTLRFDAERYRAGQTIVLHTQAADARIVYDDAGLQRPDPQTALSGALNVTLVDPAEQARETLERIERWRRQLMEILAIQKEARSHSDRLAVPLANRADAADALNLQALVFALTGHAVDAMSEPAPVVGRICELLVTLRRTHMLDALNAVKALAEATEAEPAAAHCDRLIARQDTIIEVLEGILSTVLPEAKRRIEDDPASLAEDTSLPQDGLPNPVQAIRDLQEFAQRQQRILSATLDLAKTPVDDFTDEQKRELRELAALQDELSKFMRDRFRDLSKVPPQDFANASMAQEIMEIMVDVDLAADALTREAVEMAVPFEQSGLERAEEITTNLEKWLPDAADRLQWKMEEPLGEDLDVPMAELPAELEDLIGELIEEEEALFEEAEDASSKWADSLDAGAGWEAGDGPISNFSAKGVTGNQLPNASEIGGRSGEGRTGRSHGEFVEEEATGKGARRTPTGLTPDPFELGEVKDTSNEPPGGATGGGKLSGAGGEGLEGPVPQALRRDMERLAGRQASLVNTAETIRNEFQVRNYATAELDKIVSQMRAVERELASGDPVQYRNMLRRRNVLLGSLKEAQQNLAGDIKIHGNEIPSLSRQEHERLHDVRRSEFPPEYDELLQQYYRAINRGQ